MPVLSAQATAILVSGAAALGAVVVGALLRHRSGDSVAGLALIAMTPLVPTLRIPGAFGLSSDDLLPLVGLGLLVVGLRRAPAPGHVGAGSEESPERHRVSRLQIALAVGLGLILIGGTISAVLNAGMISDVPRLWLRGSGRFAFLGLLVFAVGSTISRQPWQARTTAVALAVMGTIEAGFGLLAYLVPLPGKLGLEHARRATVLFGHVPGRVAGTLGISPDFTGAILMVTVILTVGLIGSSSPRTRRWWFAAAVLQLATLGLTFSRAPLGLAIVGVAVMLLLTSRPILLVPLAAAGAVVAWFTPLASRFLSDSNDRLALWTAAWRVMLDHPIAGVGAGQMLATLQANPEKYMQTAAGLATNNAHNTVLLAGAEMGAIAAVGALVLNLALAVMALLAIRDGAARRPRVELEIAAGLAVLAFLIQGMVNNLFTVGATSVVVALVAGAFLWNRSFADRPAAIAAPAPSTATPAP
jgi:hypothetical protein